MGKFQQEIAIVGRGCVLPDALSYEQFKQRLYSDKAIIRQIDGDRWDKELFYQPEKTECRSYSDLAAQVSLKDVREINKKFGLDKPYDTRLVSYVLESYSQVLESLSSKENLPSDMPCILGCMNPDVRFLEEHVYKTYLNRKDELHEIPKDLDSAKVLQFHEEMLNLSTRDIDTLNDESVFQTFVFKRLEQHFNDSFKGRGLLVDAACASSISSLDIACNQLLTGQEDFVIAGGVESNLSAGTFVVFSRVGALTPTTDIKPLDKESGGMVQGEGATLFALERLEDALKNGRKIYGVITGSSGSSDGRSASLFQPTQAGQEIAYDRVWRGRSEKPFFIEAHATGTAVGDSTESSSIANYFRGDKTYVGAIKGLFGHTKGNAGAISVLKSLAILEEHKVPGNTGVGPSRFEDPDFVVNPSNETIAIECESIGVSSFGFGGCNYHLSLKKHPAQVIENKVSSGKTLKVAAIKKSEVLIEDIDLNDLSFFPFPPNSVPNIDIFQIAAVKAVKDLFKDTDGLLESLGRKDINVVSAGKLGLNKNKHLVDRIVNKAIMDKVSQSAASKERDYYLNFTKKKFDESIELSEDIGPGILNNVIAGRISNVFDLHGKNYHIDKDLDSFNGALYTVALEVALDHKTVFILIDTLGEYSSETKHYQEKAVHAYLLTHPDNVAAIGMGQIGEFEIESM